MLEAPPTQDPPFYIPSERRMQSLTACPSQADPRGSYSGPRIYGIIGSRWLSSEVALPPGHTDNPRSSITQLTMHVYINYKKEILSILSHDYFKYSPAISPQFYLSELLLLLTIRQHIV